MGTISLTFTGATIDEVAHLVASWSPPMTLGRGGAASPRPAAATTASDATAIARVLSGVHGKQSLRLVRYVAEAGVNGDPVTLSRSLMREFGVESGTAFAGMIGPVNRRAKAILHRLLIDYPSADPKARVWQIAPDDARAVLDALDN